MPEPKQIQLVLQGGGAKIFALVAALDAIDRAVKDGKLEVKRIAGTSAGAIVGSLYAAGVAPSTIRRAFAEFPLDRLVQFGGWWGKGKALARALRNQPLADDRPIEKLLDGMFREQLKSGGPVRLHQLPIPTLLVASDVSGRERIVYDSKGEYKERFVVSCVMDSCAIPFFFRAAGKDAGTLVLDGGLCENLASELLVRDVITHGEVVAISFADEAPSTPRSPRELAMALLDTAINASVRRAKTAGNLFLIELDPYQIGTFDFDKAHSALSSTGGDTSKFDNARLKTAQMIDEFCSATGKRRVSKSRWENADPITMGQLLKIYKSQQLHRSFRYLSRRLIIEANSLLQEGEDDFGTRDLVVQELEFAPSQEPIDCIATIFTDTEKRPSDISCDVSDSAGQAVPFQPVPVRDPDNDQLFGLLVCFTPPLKPAAAGGETYFLRTESRVGEAFSDLKRGAVDFIESKILRADGAADRVELVIHIPKSFGAVAISSPQEAPYAPAQPMKPQELRPLRRSGPFQIYGWCAEGVPTDGIVRIDLTKA